MPVFFPRIASRSRGHSAPSRPLFPAVLFGASPLPRTFCSVPSSVPCRPVWRLTAPADILLRPVPFAASAPACHEAGARSRGRPKDEPAVESGTCGSRKWESRSRSCPRRFSTGHSNQDWSENATQWRQISSGISVTRRGMVAGAGQLCAWIIGFCGSLRREWRGLRGGRDADRMRWRVARSGPAGAAFGSLTRRVQRTGGSW